MFQIKLLTSLGVVEQITLSLGPSIDEATKIAGEKGETSSGEHPVLLDSWIMKVKGKLLHCKTTL